MRSKSHWVKKLFTNCVIYQVCLSVESHIILIYCNVLLAGELMIHIDTVQALLNTASMLQLPDVQASCSEFLKKQLHPANCLGKTVILSHETCFIVAMV